MAERNQEEGVHHHSDCGRQTWSATLVQEQAQPQKGQTVEQLHDKGGRQEYFPINACDFPIAT